MAAPADGTIFPENPLAPGPTMDDIALRFDRALGIAPEPTPQQQPPAPATPGAVAPGSQPTAAPQPPAAPQVDPAAVAANPTLTLAPPQAAPIVAGAYELTRFDAEYPDPFAPLPEPSAPAAPQPPAPGQPPVVTAPPGAAPAPQPGQPQPAPQPPALPQDGVVRTTADLAATLGATEEQLLASIQYTTPDGNQIPLSNVVSSYLAQPDAEAAAQARLTMEQENETYRQELRGVHDEALLRVGRLAQVLQQSIVGARRSPEESARLRAEDPERWVVEERQLLEREQLLGQAMAELEREGEERDKAAKAEHDKWVKAQAEEIAKVFPDLKNPATAPQQNQKIRSYLGGIGFTAKEMDDLSDARMYRVLRDAMYGTMIRKRAAAQIAQAREKGLPAPVPAVGARPEQPGAQQVQAKQITDLMTAHDKAGTVESAANVFKAMGVN